MKTFAIRVSETAAFALATILFLTTGATSASAQEFHIKGKIPFAFGANRTALPAGNYRIGQIGRLDNPPVLVVYNATTHRSVIVGTVSRVATPKDAAARAEFTCTDDGCQLVRVFDGTRGWDLVKPKPRRGEQERLVAVNLVR